jgi:hypothetical protein
MMNDQLKVSMCQIVVGSAGEDAVLSNTIGGPDNARYSKHKQVNWRGEMLTHAIDTAANWLSHFFAPTTTTPSNSNTNSAQKISQKYSQRIPKRVPCLDVVVPTYRCNAAMLRALTTLKTGADVSLNTVVVVDRPDAPTLPQIKALQSYEVDRVVRTSDAPCGCLCHVSRSSFFHLLGLGLSLALR